MLMPMARIPNAIWLPLDAIDQDMFRKAYKRGARMQSTCPRLIGVEVPGSKQQSSLLAILTSLQIPGEVEIPYTDESLDEVTRKKA